jgi:uncharacterized protein (DUF433 family)
MNGPFSIPIQHIWVAPRIDRTRLSMEHVYKFCAGSDSDAHVKMCLKNRSDLTAKQIKQAIAFERKRPGI